MTAVRDRAVCGALVERHLNLARKQARLFAEVSRVEYSELEAVGFLGLAEAAYRFDGRGAFSSFATPWVRGQILHHLRASHPLKIPANWIDLYTKGSRYGSAADAATGLGIELADWLKIKQACTIQLSDVEEQSILHSPEPQRSNLRFHAALLEAQDWMASLDADELSLIRRVYFCSLIRGRIGREQRLGVRRLLGELGESLGTEASVPEVRSESLGTEASVPEVRSESLDARAPAKAASFL